MADGGVASAVMGPGLISPSADFIVNPGLVVVQVVDLGSYNLRVDIKNTLGRAMTVKDVTLPNGRTYTLYFNLMIGVQGITS